jgi:molecular chaperone GrpE (heat shock protein)
MTQSESEKQASSQELAAMTNQIAELTNQIASAQASLFQANKDYALLENRFRRDVAERVIAERKFNNRTELKAQLENLQWNPAKEISEDRIREGLNVVVGKSNLYYVIAPE